MQYPGFEGLMMYEKNKSSSERIINAAIYEFAINGYVRSTTKAIATRAGVSEALIFKYFGNKQKLLGKVSMEIMTLRIPDLFKYRLEEMVSENDDLDLQSFSRIVSEKFQYIADNLGYIKIVFLDLSFNAEDTIGAVKSMLSSFLGQMDVKIILLQNKGIVREDLEPRSIIRSFIGMLHVLLMEKNLLDPSLDIDKALVAQMNIFMKGVGVND